MANVIKAMLILGHVYNKPGLFDLFFSDYLVIIDESYDPHFDPSFIPSPSKAPDDSWKCSPCTKRFAKG